MDKAYIKNTKDFVAQLKEEKVYKDFINYKSIIAKDEALKTKLDIYMKRRFELQINDSYGTYNSYGHLLDLQREYDDFLSEPLVQNYLKAELKFSKLLNHVFEIISEDIDFDLTFID